MRRVVAAAVSSVAIVLASRANAEPPVAVKTWPGGEVASITVAKSGKVFVGTFIEDRAVMPPSRNGELYVTDGTPAGTTRIASLGPTPGYFSAHVFPFRDDVLFGLAPDSLWSSDGTPDGTARVAEVFTTGGIALGSRIVFRAEGDGRMWATDGTTSGTAPLTACATAATLVGTTAAGALFAAEACPGSAGFDGLTLWSTDGTPAGTVPIKDISPNGQPVVMLRVRSASGQVFFATFSAVDAGTGGSAPLKLWRTDGTSNGTTLIASPSPSHEWGYVWGVAMSEAGPVLHATAAGAATAIFRLDAASVAPLGAAGTKGYGLGPEVTVAGRAIVLADNGLWSTDGTPAGTSFAPMPSNVTSPRFMHVAGVIGNRALITDCDQNASGDKPTALWVTDGTAVTKIATIDWCPEPEQASIVGPLFVLQGPSRFPGSAERPGFPPHGDGWQAPVTSHELPRLVVTDGTSAGTSTPDELSALTGAVDHVVVAHDELYLSTLVRTPDAFPVATLWRWKPTYTPAPPSAAPDLDAGSAMPGARIDPISMLPESRSGTSAAGCNTAGGLSFTWPLALGATVAALAVMRARSRRKPKAAD